MPNKRVVPANLIACSNCGWKADRLVFHLSPGMPRSGECPTCHVKGALVMYDEFAREKVIESVTIDPATGFVWGPGGDQRVDSDS